MTEMISISKDDLDHLRERAAELALLIEQRNTEQGLRKSEEKYRELIRTIHAAVVVHEADTRISICNPAAQELLGLTEDQMLRKTAVDPAWHFSREDGTVMPTEDYPVNQVIATRQPLRNLILMVHRPGMDADVWVLVSADPVFCGDGEISQVIVTFMDITERRQAEQERLANLRYFESMDRVNRAIQGASDLEQMMSDVLDVALLVFGSDRAWLLYPCDPEATSYEVPMERTRPEYPGAFAMGIEMPVDADTVSVFRVAIDSSGPVKFDPGSDNVIPADVTKLFGVQSQILMAVYPIVDRPWLFGMHQCSHARVWTPAEERLFQEIGRRLSDSLTTLLTYRNLRESEETLRRVNRTLTALSNVNQALIHATDESTLLDEVCNIAVETGGYRMAWIGYAENDPEKTIRPVAFAGHEEGLFKEIKVSWADVELGQSPIGIAIRTGKPVFVSDIASDPSCEPWRRQAEERGYASCISVPLSNAAGVFGALVLYGSMPNEFEEEEIGLLIELAGDLSYGITSLRTREERDKAEEELRLDELRLEALLELSRMTEASIHELTEFATEQGVKLTGSKVGYVAFVTDDERTLTMHHAWARQAMAGCTAVEKPLAYPVETTGLWGEAIRQRRPIVTNDYAAPDPWKKGYPEGHAHLVRHMNVPIFDGDRIVIVAGVGNKETDYNESDVRQLTLFMDGMWRIARRNEAEEALRRSEEEKRQFYRDAIRSVTDGKLEIGDRDAVSPYQAVSDFMQAFNTAEELSSTRRLVESYCSSKGLQGDALGLFTTAVGEAITNALKHAGGGEVFCGSSREELWVGVADTGPGISTLTIPSAMLRRGYSTKASLGMGFSIMLDVSDRVLLSTGPEGTIVILFKRLGETLPAVTLAELADTWDTIPLT